MYSPFDQRRRKYLKPEKLESIFNNTYDLLIGYHLARSRREMVFSTNYDPSVELWCQKRFLNCLDGTQATNNPELRQIRRSEHTLKKIRAKGWMEESEFPLIRLHGSVWTYELAHRQAPSAKSMKFNMPRSRVFFSDLYEDTLKQKPAIIFPGQEERLRRAQWDPFYQLFKEQLTRYCLFIGYSFRHDVINLPIFDNLNNGRITKLGILAPNPQKNLDNLLRGRQIQKDQIVLIPARFGEADAMWQLNVKWFSHLGPYPPHRETFLRSASKWKEAREKEHFG